jgi:hypothetical protein
LMAILADAIITNPINAIAIMCRRRDTIFFFTLLNRLHLLSDAC